MSVYIQRTLSFSEEALPMLHEPTPPPELTHRCPHCDGPVKFPTIARDYDVVAFAKMLKVAEQVLDEHGVPEKLLKEIYKKVKQEMQERKNKKNDE